VFCLSSSKSPTGIYPGS